MNWSSNIDAPTAVLNGLSMYKVELSEKDIKLLRWSFQVTADVLSLQGEGSMTSEDAMGFIGALEELDGTIVSQVKPQKDEFYGPSDKTVYQQMTLHIH